VESKRYEIVCSFISKLQRGLSLDIDILEHQQYFFCFFFCFFYFLY